MRKLLALGVVLAAAVAFTGLARAADPTPVPFPSTKADQVFVAGQTVTAGGALSSAFTPGSTVVFRAYAVDAKTKKPIATKDMKYFYVAVPDFGNVKLKFNASAPGATSRMPWTGSWKVPDAYKTGTVNFKILVQTNSKRYGSFVQMPVASAQLTIVPTAATTFTTQAIAATKSADPSKYDVSLYVDTVNGSSPVGAPKRPVGCTNTNVYKRGEQLVLRSWGYDLTTGQPLTTDNVGEAYYTIPGLPNITLPWGAHGAATNRVWFWANFWNIPADYPLGDVTIHVTFKTDAGKVGTYDHTITIIP